MRYAPDDPAFADFVNALDPVNDTADASPGFVWRLVSEESDSRSLASFEAQGWLVNMSLWESLDALKTFIRSPSHLEVMKRRTEWFERVDLYLCLWWVPDGHRPDFDEAMERMENLRRHGPTQYAFNFATPFEAPDFGAGDGS